MSRNETTAPIWRVAWRIATVVVLIGLSMRVLLAQQPAPGANASAHVAVPAAPLVGHVAGHAPAPQPIGGSGLGFKGAQAAPVRVPGVQPPVLSRSTIGGASFTRPGTALLPLGGPAKPGATGVNGTSIRPKH